MFLFDRPRDRDIHTISDFAELLCLVTADRVCSRETISDQARDVGECTLDEGDLDDCFNQLAWRVDAYGTYYPFQLDERGRILSASEELTEAQRLYALLLLCANLPFVKKLDGSLTDVFERIAFLALQAVWPKGVTRAFGKTESTYVGAKWQRINKLANDVGGFGLCNEGTFRGRDTGDGGIDLVAWYDLDAHEKRNIPSALAQCACSRDSWSAKQTEISEDRLKNSIHSTHRWNQILMIPQSFRDNRGKWAVPGDVGQVVLFDRLRILQQIGFAIDWEHIAPPPIFHSMLSERLSLV